MVEKRTKEREGEAKRKEDSDLLMIYAINKNLKDPVLSSIIG